MYPGGKSLISVSLGAEHLARARLDRHRAIEALRELKDRTTEVTVERSARTFGHPVSQGLRCAPGCFRDRPIGYRVVQVDAVPEILCRRHRHTDGSDREVRHRHGHVRSS